MPLLDMASGVRRGVNADLEVQKLQKLVRRLEEQNEALKMGSSQSSPGGRPNPKSHSHGHVAADDDDDEENNNNDVDVEDEDGDVENDSGVSCLDNVQLLDVSLLADDSQDDSWLYESPRRPATPQQKQTDALAWSRQVLDRPSPQVVAARRALLYRLDSTRGAFPKHRLSSESLSSSSCLAPFTNTLPWTSTARGPSSAYPNAPGVFHHGSPTALVSTASGQQELALQSSTATESRLTTPSHKNACQSSLEAAKRQLEMYKEGRASSESISFPSRPPEGLGREATRPFSPPSSGESDDSVLESEESRSDSKTDMSPAYKLQNVTDVQILARMQEESLRQEASASASRRSSGSSSVQSLRRSLAASDLDLDRLDDDEENEIESFGTNPLPTTAPILPHRFTPSPRQSPPPPPLSPVAATRVLRTPSPPARTMTRGLQQPRRHGMQSLRGSSLHQETCHDGRPDRTCSPGSADRAHLASPRASPPLVSSAVPRIRPSLPVPLGSRLKRPSPASSILNDGPRQGRSIGLARAPSPSRHRSPNAGSRLSPRRQAVTPPDISQEVCGRLSPGPVPIKAVSRQSGLPKLSTHTYGVPGQARSKLVQPIRRDEGYFKINRSVNKEDDASLKIIAKGLHFPVIVIMAHCAQGKLHAILAFRKSHPDYLVVCAPESSAIESLGSDRDRGRLLVFPIV